MSERQHLFALAFAFVFLWNSGFVGAEFGLPYAGPWSLLFWRYLFLSLLLGLWLSFQRRWVWPSRAAVGQAALVGILSHGVWLGGVLLSLDLGVPAGIVALITALQPLLTGVFSGVWLGERTYFHQWIGLGLGFAGVAIAVGTRIGNPTAVSLMGYLIPFTSVVAITGASILQRYWSLSKSLKPLTLDRALFIQAVATTIALIVPAWIFDGFSADWTVPFLTTMGWLVIPVSFGAYWTMWKLLEHKKATRVASLFYLSPPVTMTMAWIAFGDPVIMTDILGLVVAALGVLLIHRRSQSEQFFEKSPNEIEF